MAKTTTEEELRAYTIGELRPLTAPILVVDYDSEWPASFEREAARIRSILGDRVRLLEHAGSTSVPELPAKPIIDIVLAVPDSSAESTYVPALEAAGYVLRIREPHWFEHRVFKGPDTDVNLHVFTLGCAEIGQMLLFRDWLRTHPEDRLLYANEKRALARREWKFVQHYADAKTDVVHAIFGESTRREMTNTLRNRMRNVAVAAAAAVTALAWVSGCGLVIGADWDATLRTDQATSGDDAGDDAVADAATDACPGGSVACRTGCCVPLHASAIAAGERHTCAVTSGSVVCWGNNDWGQLGAAPSRVPHSATPLVVPEIHGASEISSHRGHNCAIVPGGVSCWGKGDDGQLGDVPPVVATPTPVFTQYIGVTIDHIAAGAAHSCLVASGAQVECWGDNTYGQLGDGTKTSSSLAVIVTGLTGAISAITTGRTHTCTIAGGRAMCWGENGGLLGNGAVSDSATPVAVTKLGPTVNAIGAGDTFTCALNGDASCWGQRPDGSLLFSFEPVHVDGLADATAISANAQACFVTDTGVKCWSSSIMSPTPIAVGGLPKAISAVAAGATHACALDAKGEVWCWGTNADGQCGVDESTAIVSTPVRVILSASRDAATP